LHCIDNVWLPGNGGCLTDYRGCNKQLTDTESYIDNRATNLEQEAAHSRLFAGMGQIPIWRRVSDTSPIISQRTGLFETLPED
jgi:hypothetical protein